ncbi:MAG: ABC transporter ATP-binding protein [Nocardioidaceae bacterium]
MTDQVGALSVSGLTLGFRSRRGLVRVLHDVYLDVGRGEIVGLVGESGSGKSVTSLQAARLLPEQSVVVESGSVEVAGADTVTASEKTMGRLRGSHIGFIFQEPMTALSPTMTVGKQLGLAIRRHTRCRRGEVRRRVVDALEEAQIPEPESVADKYPFELSGGMRQRVVIAIAMAGSPELLIADEPTTALDVTVQAEILALVGRLAQDHGMAVLFVSHDLALISKLCHRVFVMYGGRMVETGPTEQVIHSPAHPYTRALLGALPQVEGAHRLSPIPGEPPDPRQEVTGCVFAPRCPRRFDRCDVQPDHFSVSEGHSAACWLAAQENEEVSYAG